MARILRFQLFAVDLPFHKPFKHAAAERRSSDSLFVACHTDTGAVGFGECLPRPYVTGETREGAFDLLRANILPPLVGMSFNSLDQVKSFLKQCDGKAPPDWVAPQEPQTAAWCAVDIALLDAFGRGFGQPVRLNDQRSLPARARYSAVISADSGLRFAKTMLKIRLYGIRQVKLKVEAAGAIEAVRRTRRWLGRGCDIRVDANMAWTPDQALVAMAQMSRFGIRSFEQPIEASDTDGLARLVCESGLDVMVDESLGDRASLAHLIQRQACTAVNVRISKCGGLVAAHARCTEALDAGLKVQIGCQVGESSLLSAAHLVLAMAVDPVTYLEGCFGKMLLGEDPVQPVIQFGYGGKPPVLPDCPGFGVAVDQAALRRWMVQEASVE